MPRKIPESELEAIEKVVKLNPDGIRIDQIESALAISTPRRTLNSRIKYLVGKERIFQEGTRRWAKYFPVRPQHIEVIASEAKLANQSDLFVPLSKEGAKIQTYVSLPLSARKYVGYQRSFLDSYIPNQTSYLSPSNV
jgi:hypothetical protein